MTRLTAREYHTERVLKALLPAERRVLLAALDLPDDGEGAFVERLAAKFSLPSRRIDTILRQAFEKTGWYDHTRLRR